MGLSIGKTRSPERKDDQMKRTILFTRSPEGDSELPDDGLPEDVEEDD
jgi:hypothetical protein